MQAGTVTDALRTLNSHQQNRRVFFDAQFISNLSSREVTKEGWFWDLVFGIVARHLWKGRNQRVFGGHSGSGGAMIQTIK